MLPLAEGAEADFDHPLLNAVPIEVSTSEKLHNRREHGQLNPLSHRRPPKGSRESTF